MTDLDALKKMLTEAGIKFQVDHDTWGEEIDLEFTPEDMSEEVLFVFNTEGTLKNVI